MSKVIDKLSDAVFLTFWIRDGKAARDKGDVAGMQSNIDKVNKAMLDGRITAEVAALAIDKIENAEYRPNPAKAASGCVVPGRTRTYTASKVQSLDSLKALIAQVTDPEKREAFEKALTEKIAEREKKAAEEQQNAVLARIGALIAGL